MTDFLEQYAAQFRAAAEAEAKRGRRVPVAPLAMAGLAAAAVAVAVVGNEPKDMTEREAQPRPPATRTGGGYAEQRSLLGVLRERTEADADPQVRRTVRDFRDERARTGRLLGKAPSGSAFVLVATRRYPETVHARRGGDPPRLEVRWRRDGLCLMRRGTEGGAGRCGGTADLLAGRLRGAIAGQAYGVVPDGVTHVRRRPREPLVPVRRNFYVYAVRGNPEPPPVWLDANGDEVPQRLAYLNRPGGGSLADFHGRVTVVGFWASWCKPCGPQLRELQTAHERLSDRGVELLAVANSDLAADARKALTRMAVDFPVFDDPDTTLAHRFGVEAFPETLVLDAEGKVAERFRGPASADQIEEAVSRAG